jgi:hypothetical protein
VFADHLFPVLFALLSCISYAVILPSAPIIASPITMLSRRPETDAHCHRPQRVPLVILMALASFEARLHPAHCFHSCAEAA